MAIYARVAFYVTVAAALLRALGAAFGPAVKRYSPRAHEALALFGGGLLALLHDVGGLLAAMRKPHDPPSAPPPAPPRERVTTLPVPPQE